MQELPDLAEEIAKAPIVLDDTATVLFRAIQSRNKEESMRIIRSPKFNQINEVNHTGKTALHLACLAGVSDIALAVLARSDFTQVNRKDNDGWTALHCAAGWGQPQVISHILDCPTFTEADAVDRWDHTALHVAAADGQDESFEILKKHPRFTSVEKRDKDGKTGDEILTKVRAANAAGVQNLKGWSGPVIPTGPQANNPYQITPPPAAPASGEQPADGDQRSCASRIPGASMLQCTSRDAAASADGSTSATPSFMRCTKRDDTPAEPTANGTVPAAQTTQSQS